MASSKPAVVIIGGGWHVPENYRKLIKALEVAGHEVHCPHHPSMNGERPPTAGLAEDSENIRAFVEKLVDAGRRVIVVMHSYGGQVGTNALTDLGMKQRSEKGQSGGVSDLVYMCAFALENGGSMAGKVKEMGHEELMPIAFDFADDMTVLCRDPSGQLVGEGPSEEEKASYIALLRRWNGQCMYDATSSCAWEQDMNLTYVYTTTDMTVPLAYQISMVDSMEAKGCKVNKYELATGHCPNLTAVDEMVGILNKVVG